MCKVIHPWATQVSFHHRPGGTPSSQRESFAQVPCWEQTHSESKPWGEVARSRETLLTSPGPLLLRHPCCSRATQPWPLLPRSRCCGGDKRCINAKQTAACPRVNRRSAPAIRDTDTPPQEGDVPVSLLHSRLWCSLKRDTRLLCPVLLLFGITDFLFSPSEGSKCFWF